MGNNDQDQNFISLIKNEDMERWKRGTDQMILLWK